MTKPKQSVAEFYERHPYPPPTRNLDDFHSGRITETPSPRYYAPLLWPQRSPAAPRILVAGCGTAQAAKLAIQNPDCEVLGIDLSETSLAASADLKTRYQLDNLRLQRLPVEEARSLDTDFDLIVSTGVLHHLPDPDRGLHALTQVLHADGCMHLKVYAPYGRAGVYMLQDYCRRVGVEADEDSIRTLIKLVGTLGDRHPLRVFERRTPDLKTIGGTADALLHPQDRAYSVPQFIQWIEAAGLQLGRWFFQSPYLAACSKWRNSAHGTRLLNLPAAEQAAAMELLRADMIMHEALVYHPRSNNARHGLGADRWQDLTVYPMPGIRVNQLGVPQGCAAQLWHPAHAADDIRLNLTGDELALFQLMDGKRRCRDVISDASRLIDTEGATDRVRALIEDLWRHDAIMLGPGSRALTANGPGT